MDSVLRLVWVSSGVWVDLPTVIQDAAGSLCMSEFMGFTDGQNLSFVYRSEKSTVATERWQN